MTYHAKRRAMIAYFRFVRRIVTIAMANISILKTLEAARAGNWKREAE